MNKFLDNLARVLGGDRALNFISRSSDLLLAGVVIAIIMMLIFPVSPHMIDVLISINITASVSLLFVAIYIQKAFNCRFFHPCSYSPRFIDLG